MSSPNSETFRGLPEEGIDAEGNEAIARTPQPKTEQTETWSVEKVLDDDFSQVDFTSDINPILQQTEDRKQPQSPPVNPNEGSPESLTDHPSLTERNNKYLHEVDDRLAAYEKGLKEGFDQGQKETKEAITLRLRHLELMSESIEDLATELYHTKHDLGTVKEKLTERNSDIEVKDNEIRRLICEVMEKQTRLTFVEEKFKNHRERSVQSNRAWIQEKTEYMKKIDQLQQWMLNERMAKICRLEIDRQHMQLHLNETDDITYAESDDSLERAIDRLKFKVQNNETKIEKQDLEIEQLEKELRELAGKSTKFWVWNKVLVNGDLQ